MGVWPSEDVACGATAGGRARVARGSSDAADEGRPPPNAGLAWILRRQELDGLWEGVKTCQRCTIA